MAKRESKAVVYTEPDDYFPKEIRDMFKGNGKTETKKTVKKPTTKNKSKK